MPRARPIMFAAAAYWAWVFAFAFLLGVVRTLWLTPRVGSLAATMCEVPLVLGMSWLAARRLTAHYRIAHGGEAAGMGLAAFALLMCAELALATALPGQSPQAWLHGLASPAGALGLSGQVLFALIPQCAARGR